MKNGKINLSIFFVFAVVAGVIFVTQVGRVNQDIEQSAPQIVAFKSGEVAGVFQGQGPVTLKINNGQTEEVIEVEVQSGTTVLEALRQAEGSDKLSLVTEEYDFGVLIEEINGLKGGTDGKYWMYYVNGDTPTVGVDAYTLSGGDLVELKFESF